VKVALEPELMKRSGNQMDLLPENLSSTNCFPGAASLAFTPSICFGARGKDLRFDGLHERKRQLKALILNKESLLYCDHIEEHGEPLFKFACANDLEGIVAKPKNSPYQFSDTETYGLKLKHPNYTQALGRNELFFPPKKPVEPDWAGCAIAVAEAEM